MTPKEQINTNDNPKNSHGKGSLRYLLAAARVFVLLAGKIGLRYRSGMIRETYA